MQEQVRKRADVTAAPAKSAQRSGKAEAAELNGIMQLQKNIGNRAVAGMLRTMQMKADSSVIQRAEMEEEELQMKRSGEPIQRAGLEEEELQMKRSGEPIQRAGLEEEELQMKRSGEPIQRAGLEEEELQMKRSGEPIQRLEMPGEEELQMKRSGEPIQRAGLEEEELQMKQDSASPAPSAASGSDGRMPKGVQQKMEQAMQADFSDVRIHQGGEAADVGALAYAQGSDIHFAPGNYQPDTKGGQELLGHELAHVVQQRQGRVQATTQAKGLPVNDDVSLEKEADQMGAKAAELQIPPSAPGAQLKDEGDHSRYALSRMNS